MTTMSKRTYKEVAKLIGEAKPDDAKFSLNLTDVRVLVEEIKDLEADRDQAYEFGNNQKEIAETRVMEVEHDKRVIIDQIKGLEQFSAHSPADDKSVRETVVGAMRQVLKSNGEEPYPPPPQVPPPNDTGTAPVAGSSDVNAVYVPAGA